MNTISPRPIELETDQSWIREFPLLHTRDAEFVDRRLKLRGMDLIYRALSIPNVSFNY